MPDPLYINADHNVTLTGYNVAGTYLNSGTATYVLKTASGSTVTGGTGSLSYVAASNGNYLGTIESTVVVTSSLIPVVNGGLYYLEITFAQSPYNDFRRLELIGQYRSES